MKSLQWIGPLSNLNQIQINEMPNTKPTRKKSGTDENSKYYDNQR